MPIAKSVVLFMLAAVAEIGGAWLVWQRPGRSSVAGFSGNHVVCVVDDFGDEPDQVSVAQGVDDVAAVLSGVVEAAEAKFGEVLADHGAGHSGSVRQFRAVRCLDRAGPSSLHWGVLSAGADSPASVSGNCSGASPTLWLLGAQAPNYRPRTRFTPRAPLLNCGP